MRTLAGMSVCAIAFFHPFDVAYESSKPTWQNENEYIVDEHDDFTRI